MRKRCISTHHPNPNPDDECGADQEVDKRDDEEVDGGQPPQQHTAAVATAVSPPVHKEQKRTPGQHANAASSTSSSVVSTEFEGQGLDDSGTDPEAPDHEPGAAATGNEPGDATIECVDELLRRSTGRQPEGIDIYSIPADRRHQACAELFVRIHSKNAIAHSGDVYVYDLLSGLWKEKSTTMLGFAINAVFVHGERCLLGSDKRARGFMSSAASKKVAVIAVRLLDSRDMALRLNATPRILAIAGGMVVDLRTGSVRPGARDDYFTIAANASWNPTADRTEVVRFMSQACCERADLLAHLQRLLGYCLIGNNPLRKILFFRKAACVIGGTGGSTLAHLMRELLGKFYHAAHATAFTCKPTSRTPTSHHIQMMRYARMTVVQYGEDLRCSRDRLRTYRDGGVMAARRCKRPDVEFLITFVPVILSTKPPSFFDDPDLRESTVVFPLDAVCGPYVAGPGRYTQDTGILQRLNTPDNLSALLAWLVEGAMACIRDMDAGSHNPLAVPGK
jgi:hypothetical protein